MPIEQEDVKIGEGVAKRVNLRTKAGKKKGKKSRKKRKTSEKSSAPVAKFPRHSVEKALRVPKAILEQNAGKECADSEAAGFLGVKLVGPVQVGSALKYGFLNRPTPGRLELTDLVRRVLRPQGAADVLEGYRQAVLKAPEISDVYKALPGRKFAR